VEDTLNEVIVTAPEVLQQPTPPPSDLQAAGSTDTHIIDQSVPKRMDIDEDTSAPDMLSPMSAEGDKQEESELPALTSSDLGSPPMGYDFSNVRVRITRRHHLINYANKYLFSLYRLLLPPFSALAAGSRALNSPNAKDTMSRLKSSTLT